jgi:hypothetical protein
METLIKLDLSNTAQSLRDLEVMIAYVKMLEKNSKGDLLLGYREHLGERALALFETIISQAKQNGETSLEEISSMQEWNCSPSSLRGTMMNAGRTLNKLQKPFPFHAEWNDSRQCVIYSLKKN